jgi:hypothetical protein
MVNIGRVKKAVGKHLCCGGHWEHLNGSKSAGYVGGCGKVGQNHCLSFITQNHIDCILSPKRKAVGATWNDVGEIQGVCATAPIVTKGVFDKFVDFVSTIHPRVAECIEEQRPDYALRNLRINTGNGNMNYFVMTQWRMLWSSSQGVYMSVYLHERGYTWPEVMAIVGAMRESRLCEFGGGTDGIPFEYGEYYAGTLTYIENAEKEKVQPYGFNGNMRDKLAKGNSIYLQQFLANRGVTCIDDLRDKREVFDELVTLLK